MMKPIDILLRGIGTGIWRTPCLALASLLVCVGADAAGNSAESVPTGKDAIYLNTLPDGSVELSNSPQGEQSEQLSIEPPAEASQGPENPYRLRTPYGTTATAPEAAPQGMPSDNEPAARNGGDSNGLASASSVTPTVSGGGYAGMNSYANLRAPTSGTNTGSLAAAPTFAAVPEPSAALAPTGSGSGSTTATSSAAAPISWQGSIPASAVNDPYLAAKLPLIGSALLATGNAAIGRRYLMMDRNTYLSLYGVK
jgi:hypothetical protein